jgi:hypothetical protein
VQPIGFFYKQSVNANVMFFEKALPSNEVTTKTNIVLLPARGALLEPGWRRHGHDQRQPFALRQRLLWGSASAP